MKRDLELIRKILIAIEDKESISAEEVTIDGHTFEEVAFHLMLLEEAGFVKAVIDREEGGEIVLAVAERLTWDGFEFLQLSRNDTAWQKAKNLVKDKAVTVSVAILAELLKSFIKDAVGLGSAQPFLPQSK